jgi:translation initiation factor IF-2
MISNINVITFIGHVNHGKTTLLDYILKTKKQEEETKGITQSNSVNYYHSNKHQLIFIDTPGHDDISVSRNKMIGANVCDFYVLIISAKEGIKPSFLPVFKLIRDTDTKMVVFITNIDNESDLEKYQTNIEKIKDDLFSVDIKSSEFVTKGRSDIDSVSFIYGSGKTGFGVDSLLDLISSDVTNSHQQKIFDSLPDNFAVQVNSMYDQKNKHLPRYSDIVMRKGVFNVKDNLITDNNFATIEKIVDISTNENVNSTDTLKPYRLFLK